MVRLVTWWGFVTRWWRMKTGDMVHDDDWWHGDDGWRLVTWFMMRTGDTVMINEDWWHGNEDWWLIISYFFKMAKEINRKAWWNFRYTMYKYKVTSYAQVMPRQVMPKCDDWWSLRYAKLTSQMWGLPVQSSVLIGDLKISDLTPSSFTNFWVPYLKCNQFSHRRTFLCMLLLFIQITGDSVAWSTSILNYFQMSEFRNWIISAHKTIG